jgi:type I restriction enzyme S subunit
MKGEWKIETLGNLCEVIAGQSPEGKFYNSAGDGLPFYQGKKDFGDKFIKPATTWTSQSTKIALKRDILISVRAPVGPVNFSSGTICIGRGLAAIRCRPVLDSDFLLYQLLHLQPEIAGKAGAVFPSINKSEIESLPIAFVPLPEQRRIVGILDEAFEGITTAEATAKNNLRHTRALFESCLDQAFSARDGEWHKKHLEDVVNSNCTLSYGIVQPGDEYPNGLPIVRPTDLTSKLLLTTGLKRIDPKLANAYRRTTLHGGELLLCVRGSTGAIGVASTELAGANVTRGIVPIVFNDDFITKDFGYYLMISGMVQSQIREKTYGTALMQINIRDLRKLMVVFPTIEKQGAITTMLHELFAQSQRLLAIYQLKLNALSKLKTSLLHQAFSGQL